MSEEIIASVITTMPLHYNDREKEDGQKMIAEVYDWRGMKSVAEIVNRNYCGVYLFFRCLAWEKYVIYDNT